MQPDATPPVNPWLAALHPYETGKPIDETARELGLDPAHIIKLASNENPLGPSPKAVEAMRVAAEQAHLYPDGGGYHLRHAIARARGLDIENVVLSNGSNEIIELLGHCFLAPGTETVVAEHAFVVYRLMSELFGARCIEVPDMDFRHDLRGMLRAITPATRLVFIANPNNPTGTSIGQDEIDDFMERVPPRIVTIFDEAYHEFMDDPPDTLKFVREGRNVAVMRTFSKSQGLAGLRIGYGMMPAHIAQWLNRARQPFNANALAQAAALASLADAAHQRRTREVVDAGRARLEAALAAASIAFVPSSANFVLLKVGRGRDVFQALLRKGVIVRPMDGYKLPEWIRVSIGTPPQMDRFLAVLAEILNKPALAAHAAAAR